MIKFENVSFKYPGFELKNLNFQIPSGEIVAITGNNASGKTTMLNLMAGLIKPKSGKILVENEKPICGKKIGIVFQNPDNQIIFSRVKDDIGFTLKNQKVPKADWEKMIAEALNLVNLSGFENHETHTLSAGQKQRLVIANMLALNPKVLLFDEVSVYLDPASKNQLFKIFENLKKNGITIIFATNLLGEIVYADKVMVLDNGEVKAFAPKEEIIKNLDIFKSLNIHVPLKLEIINKLGKFELKTEEEILKELWGEEQCS